MSDNFVFMLSTVVQSHRAVRICCNNSLRFFSTIYSFTLPNLTDQIAAAVIAGAMAIAPAAFAADLENGAQVFAGNCAACHAGGNNVILNEKVHYCDLISTVTHHL